MNEQPIQYYDCMMRKGQLDRLPDEVARAVERGVLLRDPRGGLRLLDEEQLDAYTRLIQQLPDPEPMLRMLFRDAVQVDSPRSLAYQIMENSRREGVTLSHTDAVAVRFCVEPDGIRITAGLKV